MLRHHLTRRMIIVFSLLAVLLFFMQTTLTFPAPANAEYPTNQEHSVFYETSLTSMANAKLNQKAKPVTLEALKDIYQEAFVIRQAKGVKPLVPPASPPEPFPVPDTIDQPAPEPYKWAPSFEARKENQPSNRWQGHPDYMVPVAPGVRYIVSGWAKRGVVQFSWMSYYACPYMVTENTITDTRYSGGGLNGPCNDPSASSCQSLGCSGPWSNGEDVYSTLRPTLTGETSEDVEGVHLNIHAGGNANDGEYSFHAEPAKSEIECDAYDAPVDEGDPVNTRSGKFYLSEQDLGLETGCQGIFLRFERTYNLQAHIGSLGPAWVHNYEQKILVYDNTVLVRRARGGYLQFRDVGGDVYAGPPGSQHILLKRPNNEGWALVYLSRQVDLFDVEGRLEAQQDPNGNLIWLTYEEYEDGGQTESRLARVDAPGERYLWFAYDEQKPERMIMVGDHSGREVHFGYGTESSNISMLTAVTDTLGGVMSYEYDNWLMTSKIDPEGSQVFHNTYDADGRVTHQINNQGEELTFSYSVVHSTNQISYSYDGAGEIGPTTVNVKPFTLTTTVIDQTGAENIYIYGFDGLLRSHIDPLGATTTYRRYATTRTPTEIVDPLGNVTQIEYNEFRNPLEIVDALGNSVSFAYDDWSKPTQMTDPLGHSYHFTYDGPNLIRLEDPLGQTVELDYSEQNGWQGMLSTIINQAGHSTTFDYDVAGDLTQITDALGGLTAMQYDNLGRPTDVTDPRGSTTTLGYDVADRIEEVNDALGESIEMEYDAVGNLVRLTDQVGAITELTYEQSTFPVTLEDAEGGLIQIKYGPLGRPVAMTDQLGNTTVIEYDLAGRPIVVTDANGYPTQYQYDLMGNITAIIDANGHATTIEYDAIYRPIKVTNAEGQFLRYEYDEADNIIAIHDALRGVIQISYDELKRPATVTNQVGGTTTYAYNALGLIEEVIDANKIVTHYLYDELGRVSEVIANYRPGVKDSNEVNVRTRYEYDANGNLVTLLDPRNNATSFTYDGRNQLTSVTDPLKRIMTYAYDSRGLLERRYKADGTQIDYSYDLLGQLNTIAAPDQKIGYDYDAAGRRTMMSDQTGKTSYQYDAVGRPTEITLSTGETVGYSYDPVGNRSQLIYPDGKTVNYDYNKANQLTKLTDWNDQVTSYRYDQNGRLNSMILPNGIYTTLRYDAAGHLKNLKHSPGFTLSSIASYWYEYDGTGRRTAVHEQGRKTTYDYDPLYRLTYVVEIDEKSAGESGYGYDAAGNRLFKYGRSGEVKATYDEANQLTSLNDREVLYDKNGNLINDGQTSYSYDSLDRLTRTSSRGISTNYGYTGDGDRIWQGSSFDEPNWQDTSFDEPHWQATSFDDPSGQDIKELKTTFTLDVASDLTQLLGQQSGDSRTHFLPGIGQQTNDEWSYYQADALGSVRHITGERGRVKGQMRYTPFGERYETEGFLPLMGFTGEPQNEKTDLTYLRARYYNPSLGRFLTPDSIVPDPMNGQAWNRYAYVYNDVVNLTDPSGHNPLGFAALGFASGFGGSIAGQIFNNGWHGWDCINWTDAFIAGGVGAVAGYLYPFFGASPQGAVGLPGVANMAQYTITEWSHGNQATIGGLLGSGLLGVVGGLISGPYSPLDLPYAVDWPFSATYHTYDDFIEQNMGDKLWYVIGNTVRTSGAGLFTNTDIPDMLTEPLHSNDGCGC